MTGFMIDSRLAPIEVIGTDKPIKYHSHYFVSINVTYANRPNMTLLKHISNHLDFTKNEVFISGVGSGIVEFHHISRNKFGQYFLVLYIWNTSPFHQAIEEGYHE